MAALIDGGDRLLSDGNKARRGATNDLLARARAGAMLHTDAAAARWTSDRAGGQRHVDLAADWARLAGKLGDDAFERRWTLAAGLLLVELGSREGRVEAALKHFDVACARYGQDVPLLLAAAWLEERTAVASLPLTPDGLEPSRSDFSVREKRDYLERARGRVERAQRADPANAEAALRWAHVQVALGQAREARRRLDDLLHGEPTLDRAAAYLAHTLLGQALHALDDPAAAAAAYDAAIAVLPHVQTARLGRLAVSGGAPPVAGGDALGLRGDEGDAGAADPWIDYLVGRLAYGPQLRAELRAELRRGARR